VHDGATKWGFTLHLAFYIGTIPLDMFMQEINLWGMIQGNKSHGDFL
jgi:hypothetical protein